MPLHKVMKLIIGLGNPSKEYAHNRHNVGFLCINHLARIHSAKSKLSQCKSQISITRIANTETVLAKPKTFVNRSGEATRKLMRKYHISPDDLIVIQDDLDLPLGKLRIRQGGSSGGHNGIKSIISSLGTQDFCRVRIGISRPDQEDDTVFHEEDVINHVLSNFTGEEKELISPAITRAAEAIECIIAEGINAAMNKFN